MKAKVAVAEKTDIGWTDHTINLWWGCEEVAPECDECYARLFATRVGKADAWQDKRFAVPGAFANLDKWQRHAAAAKTIRTVFSMSMGDLFEKDRPLYQWVKSGSDDRVETGYTIADRRREFFEGIASGRWPNLIFLSLTKRPGNIRKSVPSTWLSNWPTNLWTGTSVGSKKSLPQIERLLRSPGNHFVSFEPLLESVGDLDVEGIDWAIVGVESRGSHVGRLPEDSAAAWNDAAASLVARLQASAIPTYVKQVPINGKVSIKIDNVWDRRLKYQQFPSWGHNPLRRLSVAV
jgi:protein gp37